MKEWNSFVIGVTINLPENLILFNIKALFMRELNTNAYLAAMKHPEWQILENTKSLCMMESNTLANIAYCSYQATTNGNLKKHQKSVHDGVKYPCKHCSYQANTNGSLKEHKKISFWNYLYNFCFFLDSLVNPIRELLLPYHETVRKIGNTKVFSHEEESLCKKRKKLKVC